MNQLDTTDKTCVSSLKLLGDFWTLRIIDTLTSDELRFCDLQRALGNVNPVTLTDRLKKLEEAKLVNRTEESIDKCSVSYSLTQLGNEALPVVKAVNSFSLKAKNSQV
jgi:DNA-binding HxlR family transcriptional regulator